MLVTRGLERVLADLTTLGYDARWTIVGAADVGAPHQRDRIWIVGKMAYATKLLCNGGNNNTGKLMGRESVSELRDGCRPEDVADSKCLGSHTKENEQVLGGPRTSKLCFEQSRSYGSDWWATEPNMGRVAHGVAAGVDRLKAIGNGQVSEVARRAWELLA
jgi:DNA (cytosine-5)-methyltransferase 1